MRRDPIITVLLGLIVAADLGLALFLAWVGLPAFFGAEGTGEGILALAALLASAFCFGAAVAAVLLWRKSRLNWPTVLAFGVALLPVLPVIWFVQPDPWTFPKAPELRCFNPAKRDQLGEVGFTVEREIILQDRLFPPRPADFVWVLPEPDGRKLKMDCSNTQRCKYRDGTDDELRALLVGLPHCFW